MLDPAIAAKMEARVTGEQRLVEGSFPMLEKGPKAIVENDPEAWGKKLESNVPKLEAMTAAELDGEISRLKADFEKKGEVLRPIHPKMQALRNIIEQAESVRETKDRRGPWRF